MEQNTASRTQDEIVARIKQVAADDWLGFRQEVLIGALDFEHAKPFLKPETTAEGWKPSDIEDDARGYLDFAVGKIVDHRGISASRSVDKLTEYAWLLGRDDVVAAMDGAHYPQYGAPKVKAFADGMGWSWPADADLARMANGGSCSDDCQSGCSR